MPTDFTVFGRELGLIVHEYLCNIQMFDQRSYIEAEKISSYTEVC